MKFIVVRAIPFTPNQQRRRQRRPDSFDMSKHRATEHRAQSTGAERPMDDDRLHQPAQKSSKQADHLPLLPLAPSFSSPQLPTTGLPSAALTPIAPLVYRRSSILSHPDDSHGRHVDAFTDWIVRLTYELVALSQGPPLVVPLTVTFSLGSTAPDQVLREYERFYARLCRLLMCNHERPSKRHLLPFALAFRDDPSTRPGRHRDRPSAF